MYSLHRQQLATPFATGNDALWVTSRDGLLQGRSCLSLGEPYLIIRAILHYLCHSKPGINISTQARFLHPASNSTAAHARMLASKSFEFS